MSQLRQHHEEFSKHGVACLVVTFESLQRAQWYVRQFQLDWPMLVDEDRTLYRAYHLEAHAGLWNLFHPAFWPRYLALMLQGRRVRRPTGDIHQMGGDVLIDPHGIVRLQRSSETPIDRPAPDQLLGVIGGGG